MLGNGNQANSNHPPMSPQYPPQTVSSPYPPPPMSSPNPTPIYNSDPLPPPPPPRAQYDQPPIPTGYGVNPSDPGKW
uniref:Uncharacterized protein n=1 Tax=Panagrolaimus davidi TaxID=227884 RepID=A0A914Q0F8_9BILA